MERALIVIDTQVDFCPGGALGVPGGDQIVPQVNELMDQFEAVVLTQDWHPRGHLSFASSHPRKAPYDITTMSYGRQVLWPDHCVADTPGAAFHPDLRVGRADMIIRKGFRRHIDSYSAFYENDRETPTGLSGYLRTRGVTALTFVGLAFDFCVAWSALDAVREGFETSVIEDATRAIDLNGSRASARADLQAAGVTLL